MTAHFIEHVDYITDEGKFSRRDINTVFFNDEEFDAYVDKLDERIPGEITNIRAYHHIGTYRGFVAIGKMLKPVWQIIKDGRSVLRGTVGNPYAIVKKESDGRRSYKRCKCIDDWTGDISICWSFSEHGAKKIAGPHPEMAAVPLLEVYGLKRI